MAEIVEQTRAQLIQEINGKFKTLSRQVDQSAAAANQRFIESNTTAAKAQQSSSDVLSQVEQLKKQLSLASDTIAAQEKKITDTSELVKAIFSRGQTDFFVLSSSPPSTMVVIKHDDNHASIYFLLKDVPIEQTIQLQYHVFTQPKGSYTLAQIGGVSINILGFRWGEAVTNLMGKLVTVSYISDPTSKSERVKALSVKDNRAYADGHPLPYTYPEFEPKPN